jgi:ABC-type xylose transport system permease subunit
MGDFARQIVTGLIIVAAVIIDTYRNRLLTKIQVSE